MPLGSFESEVLRIIAQNRSPDSHVAGATILNLENNSPRFSQDIDVFHDSLEALVHAFATDIATLKSAGYSVNVQLNGESFKRALVGKGGFGTRIEWLRDSAFRFFPVEPDPNLGYRLNRWDAATNKILAAAGRIAIRDYIDLLHLHTEALSLGALTWAAAAKDVGLSPGFILEEMQRLQKYSMEEYNSIQWRVPPKPQELKQVWRSALQDARELFDLLLELDAPYGCFFLNGQGEPQTPTRVTLPSLRPHYGTLRGCWPRIVEE